MYLRISADSTCTALICTASLSRKHLHLLVELVWGGNHLAFSLTVGGYHRVALKTQKHENPISEQQREMEEASRQHPLGEIRKPYCFLECARIQTQGAPVCSPRSRIKASG